MPHPQIDRRRIKTHPLSERTNRVDIERDHVAPDAEPRPLTDPEASVMAQLIERVREARRAGRPVMAAFGAHTIKNGLGPLLARLLRDESLTHLATNGAGIIHDWEFARAGASSEHVEENMKDGRFGLWEETGYFINLAINVGAYHGLGYGESVGALIYNEGLELPSAAELEAEVRSEAASDPAKAAAAADLLATVQAFDLSPGRLAVEHPSRAYSLQAAAFERGVPFTGHPMFGHDVIYNHPMNNGAALGRAALRDYLSFAESVSRLEGGVYLSIGSAVMSPMVFEKSMALAQNLAAQRGERIENHYLCVVDLAKSSWDWSQGEPPEDHAEYYLRYNKTFSRVGGTMRYLCMDNRDFLLHLYQGL